MSRRVQVTVLGAVTLRQDDRPAPAMSTKALELLCYLLLHRDRAQERETLAGLLWPDSAAHAARKYLRQALWQLQAALGANPAVPLLHADATRLRIEPAAWWCDAYVVEGVHRRCREAGPGALPPELAAAVEQAVGLHRGELLESWDHDWCVRERDRWRLMHLDLLDRLVDHCLGVRALDRGLAHATRLLELDPARESAHRLVMRLHLAAGDRAGALRQYRRCVQALAVEFDMGPAPETVELHRRIRAGAPVPVPVTDGPPPADLGPTQRIEARLDAMAAALGALQRDIALLVALQQDGRGGVRRSAVRDEPLVPLRSPMATGPLAAGDDREAG